MSSFSCPHIVSAENKCLKLKRDCVPGRPGCVLANRFQFAVPIEKRLVEKDSEIDRFKKFRKKKI
jgi:hypothetical protein